MELTLPCAYPGSHLSPVLFALHTHPKYSFSGRSEFLLSFSVRPRHLRDLLSASLTPAKQTSTALSICKFTLQISISLYASIFEFLLTPSVY